MNALIRVIITIKTESLIIVFAHKHAKNPIKIPKRGPPIDTRIKLTITLPTVAV